jgi:hypothetical protein
MTAEGTVGAPTCSHWNKESVWRIKAAVSTLDPGLKMQEHLCFRYCKFQPFQNLNCSACERAA